MGPWSKRTARPRTLGRFSGRRGSACHRRSCRVRGCGHLSVVARSPSTRNCSGRVGTKLVGTEGPRQLRPALSSLGPSRASSSSFLLGSPPPSHAASRPTAPASMVSAFGSSGTLRTTARASSTPWPARANPPAPTPCSASIPGLPEAWFRVTTRKIHGIPRMVNFGGDKCGSCGLKFADRELRGVQTLFVSVEVRGW